MAVYQFSALSDGQAISFNPTADVLNFDQSSIAAADIRVSISGANTRIDVVAGPQAGKDITLLNTAQFQLATSNVTFVDGSLLLFGDNSTATGDDGGNTLNSGSGRDLILAFGGSDTINLAAASYGAGDVIDGGAGYDSLIFTGTAASGLVIDFAAGIISGGGTGGAGSATFANIERLTGGSGNDSISGNAVGQNIGGAGGNDTLWGAGGNDTLWGIAGADTFVFRETGAANADLIGDFASGTDKISLDASVMTALGAAGNFGTGDARFWAAAGATGGHDADDRVVYNTTTRQIFYDADGSGSGAAQLIATLQSGATLVATDIVISGTTPPPSGPTEGDDSLVGTSGNDTIDGLGGNDTIDGLAGNDVLIGGAGADSLVGGDGNDTLRAGMDGAHGDGFVDTLDGGVGDDVYFVTDDGDTILADPGGVDTVVVEDGSWTLGAGLENLDLMEEDGVTGIGNELDNVIRGGAEGTDLYGMGGNDLLIAEAFSGAYMNGGDGNDTLTGGGNNSTVLEGGSGADNFNFRQPAFGSSDINDFASGVDKIRLDATAMSALGASGDFAAGDARFYAAAGATGGHDADDRVVYNTTTRELFYDPDGNGAQAAQLIVTLQAGATLVATDIAVDNGIENQTINGGPGNDTLTGGPGNDTINGFGGNDSIDGGQGADSLIGGDGNDTLSAGFDTSQADGAADTLDGGLGDDVYLVHDDGDTIVSDPGGIDTVVAVNASWTLASGFENLDLDDSVGSGFNGTGNELDNVIRSASEGGTLDGMGGNDLLIARHAQNTVTLRGGDGNDTLRGGSAGNAFFGDAGDDVLVAGVFGDNNMSGGSGADSFVFTQPGGSGSFITDLVSGMDKIRLDATSMSALGASGNFAAGDARFYAAAGATGGHDADDRVIYNTSTGDLFYDSDGNGAQAAELIVRLQAGATLVATDIAVDNGTSGGAINGTAGNDSLTGTAGNDTINGLAGNDTLRGFAGDDVLDGGDGVDSLDGGFGNDTYIVTSGDVIVSDPEGIDTVVTAVSWNLSSGNLENVTMTGTAAISVEGNNLANSIVGNDGNNYFNARGGNDTISGNAGNDLFNMSMGGTTSFGNDSIDGGAGVDSVEFATNAKSGLVADLAAGTVTGGETGGAGSSTILNIERFIAGDFNDQVTGSSAANYLDGRGGNDTVSGAAGNDTLLGGIGNDRLAGGTGNDTLTGGAGLDSFVFAEAPGSANVDRITDFVSASDKVLLDDAFHSNIGAAGNFSAGDGRFYAAAGATAGHDANDRVIYNTSTGSLYYDADGNGAGAAQLIATLTGNPAVAATDIAVI
jgi:Ca2+-binding RTX toxin-like protein